MATIKNLVNFAAKFLDMAKAKGKDKKKVAAKSKGKPVAKKVAKKPAKKVAPKAKKAPKPVTKTKTKPVAKKVVKAKPVKKAVATKKPVVVQKKKTELKEKPVAKAATKVQPKVVVKAPVKPVLTPHAANGNGKTAKTQNKVNMKKPGQDELNHRYSDEDLKEFKELIEQKLVAAREELKNLKESLDNHTESQAGNKAWNMEEGTDTSEMEYLMNQISRQHQYIRNLELALVRVENKTYGICRITGKLIPKERLRIVPHATLSLEAKMTRKTEDLSPGASAVTPPSDFSEGFED